MSNKLMKAIGVLVCLTGGFLISIGNFLGESTSGIATVLGIIGIGSSPLPTKLPSPRNMERESSIGG